MEQKTKDELLAMTDGLEAWCASRQRRRTSLRQTVLLCVALAATTGVASAMIPPREGTWVQGSHADAPEVAIQRVDQILLMS